MKGERLPSTDTIVRYVKPSMVQEDGNPDGSEFRLRSNGSDDTGLSVNWLEIFGNAKPDQLANVRKVSRLRRKPTGRFAEMNVGTVLQTIGHELHNALIVHDPLPATEEWDADPSHSEFVGLPPQDSDQALLVGDLIAQCVVAMHPAVTEGEH